LALTATHPDGEDYCSSTSCAVLPLEAVAKVEFQFIWRCLRRLGVWPDDKVDDAAQKVFEVATRKWSHVTPGKESEYLYRIAANIAAEMRRARRVGQREQSDGKVVDSASQDGEEPEALFQERQYRSHLDDILNAMPDDLREVFVLYEIERLRSVDIAALTGQKLGTVSSRLRRAREIFREQAARVRLRLQFSGELP
jgi:RNA polymerase sigma-70 factor (ECF subfamily)